LNIVSVTSRLGEVKGFSNDIIQFCGPYSFSDNRNKREQAQTANPAAYGHEFCYFDEEFT